MAPQRKPRRAVWTVARELATPQSLGAKVERAGGRRQVAQASLGGRGEEPHRGGATLPTGAAALQARAAAALGTTTTSIGAMGSAASTIAAAIAPTLAAAALGTASSNGAVATSALLEETVVSRATSAIGSGSGISSHGVHDWYKPHVYM